MRLLYLSPLPWSDFAQRPHRFVEWFHARHRDEILWIDPYPTRLPALADLRRLKSTMVAQSNITNSKIPPWLRVVRPTALPIEPLPGSGLLNRLLWGDLLKLADHFLSGTGHMLGIGKPSAFALQVMSGNPGVQSLYDAMDDFPLFYKGLSRVAMAKRESALAAKVTKLLVSSTALAEKFSVYNDKTCLALNACALATLPGVNAVSTHADTPVFGYVGTIGPWFDWSLVITLANANPTMRIRLIGPMYCPPSGKIPNNIEILPACDHSDAILAMQKFSIGLIPFRRTQLTDSADPIKYYEYRALGLPVLSTDFGEMRNRKDQSGIFIVDERSELPYVIEKAQAYRPNRNEIEKFRTKNSWEARFDACDIFSLNSKK